MSTSCEKCNKLESSSVKASSKYSSRTAVRNHKTLLQQLRAFALEHADTEEEMPLLVLRAQIDDYSSFENTSDIWRRLVDHLRLYSGPSREEFENPSLCAQSIINYAEECVQRTKLLNAAAKHRVWLLKTYFKVDVLTPQTQAIQVCIPVPEPKLPSFEQ